MVIVTGGLVKVCKEETEYRGDFRIVTDVKKGEEVAHGTNTKVYLDGKLVPYLAACHIRIVAQESVKLMLEIIPRALELEIKNAKASVKFAYHESTPMWHDLKELIDERNARRSEEQNDGK